MLLTALLRTWATSYLRSDVMQDNDLHAEKSSPPGPYRHVRNPLYLGNILMASAWDYWRAAWDSR